MSAATSSDRFPELDKYEVLEEIGHGGMATVYRARDPRLDREVALKVIHKHLRENAEVRRRFTSEAKAVAKLRHHGIVEVYDVSDDADPERYLVVELIRGTTLRRLLERHGALPPEIAAIIVGKLCEAVQHAHDSGVIHRDIKPENVLVELGSESSRPARLVRSGDDEEGPRTVSEPPPDAGSARSERNRVGIKLTDFGIAKVLDAQGVTSTGQILGSPAHMAPEQIEGGDIGAHTDVFALGVLMYECMVGHLPFEGKNPAQVLRKVLEGIYERADAERPEVGGRWASILAAALELRVADRLGTAAELGTLIDEELAALGIDTPERSLADFFADPGAFSQRLCAELVPLLLARGEHQRRAGQVQGAAADFNRALALCPDDLGILKRVSTLSAQTRWSERLVRLGKIAAGSLVLGACAFGLTRLVTVREPAARLASGLVRVNVAAPSATTRVAPIATVATAGASPSASASSRVRPGLIVDPRPLVTAIAPASRKRAVRFALNPMGARLTLQGAAVAWLGVTHPLAPGSYPVVASMPEGQTCCDELRTNATVTAAPEEDPDSPQVIVLRLPIKPAKATLRGGPSGAAVSCPNGLVVAKGGTATVKMTDVTWAGTCTFTPGGRSSRVVLTAGSTTGVDWPGP